MHFLVDKEKIQNEMDALKQNGYEVTTSAKMRIDGKSVTTIDIAPIGKDQGIIVIISPNSTFGTPKDHATLLTFLKTKDLDAFIKNFPENVAPTIAAGL